MYSKIISIFIIMLCVIQTNVYAQNSNNYINKIYIYGHVFLDNQSNPLRNINITLKENNVSILNTESNSSGYYEFFLEEDDNYNGGYVDICIQSNGNNNINEFELCKPTRIFIEPGILKNDNILTRNISQNFLIDNKGNDLHEKTLEEIKMTATEGEIDRTQENIRILEEIEEEKKALEEAKKLAEELKAKYKMPPYSKLSGPLKEIHISGMIENFRDRINENSFSPNSTSVIVTDYNGNTLRNVTLGKDFLFNFTIKPKGNDFFEHPPILTIRNSQEDENGNKIYKNYQELITVEYYHKNIKLDPYNEIDIKQLYKKPNIYIIISIIAGICFILVIIVNLVIKEERYSII